jgi:hypothetical protein
MPIPTTGAYVVKPSTHRCFDHLVTAQATGQLFSKACFAAPIEIHHTPNDVLDPIRAGGWPTEIQLTFGPGSPPVRQVPAGIVRLMLSTYSHAFVTYFEASRAGIDAKYGANPKAWSGRADACAFGWVIRNGLAHGGVPQGSLRIADPSIRVTWRDLTLTSANHGEPVLYHQVTQGDLMLLMLDIDEEVR